MSGSLQDRRNWTRSLTIVVVVAAVAVILAYFIPESPAETDRKYLRNTAGAVLFDHGAHNEMADSCAVCHHSLYSSVQATTCEDCHGEDMGAEDFSHDELKEIHGTDCSQCHEQIADDDQAASCRQCHPAVQQSETSLIGCMECHDDDSYSPDIMDHDEYLEIEEHTCLGCHAPGSLSEVYHTSCTNCHLENSPEQFTEADGEVLCAACHLR
ncbi:MAG: cytochrome c3 family protein [Desulfocapsaceae bacterium]|nr:cytochrome c3 family protein [Desulfocapsaceae bacterium]